MVIDRARLLEDLVNLTDKSWQVADRIHKNPELRFEEHQASQWLSEAIRSEGLEVTLPLAGLATAFRSSVGAGEAHVAFLAEYDALPEMGHACGHNLIAGGALLAFLGLAKQAPALAGRLSLIGTPAEEGGGGKIKLLEAGEFEGLDAALMFHPFDRDLLCHPTLGNAYVTFDFKGKSSHAAIAPWDGASALTACLDTFRLVDSQRIHFRDGVRVHGYITCGGQAVNIIPERASAEFSVRSFDASELDRVRAIVERCAKGAAMASGVEVEITFRPGYRDMKNNLTLARRFGEHLRGLGRAAKERDDGVGTGSTDMGDISHAVPSIHPWIAICDENHATCHQHEFARSAGSPRGCDAMVVAAKSMALLAADVLEDAELRAASRQEFEASRSAAQR